jgi:hypothetical protein
VVRHFLIQNFQLAAQFSSVSLRILFEASECLDELVQLHFRTVGQSVDPLKPKGKGDAKRNGHAGAGADCDPGFSRHREVALRMKKARNS